MKVRHKNKLALIGMSACTAYFISRALLKNEFDYLDRVVICSFIPSHLYLTYRMLKAGRQIRKQPSFKRKIMKAYEQYDGLIASPLSSPLNRMILLRKILEDVNPENKTLVSLGGGLGIIESKFADLGSSVVNVDIYKKDLVRCKNKNPDVECILADGENLPFRDESIDILFSSGAAGHLDCPKVFEEACSVLKQDGIVKISTYSYTKFNRFSFYSLYNLYPTGKLAEMAKEAGFDNSKEEEHILTYMLFIPRKMTMMTAKK
jgi:ubiquinone/menaquinone biosynthesis C-methylase UbiE